jgi:DnaJ-domain-containing protein 1
MGIWERLGSVINSYINDTGGEKPQWRQTRQSPSGDPDLNEAYEELDDYLNGKETRSGGNKERQEAPRRSGATRSERAGLPPEELRPDFECLGVPFGASAEECKAAYKRLLKIHHPDRHAGHEGDFKKATEKSAKINAAWDRIEKWREGA